MANTTHGLPYPVGTDPVAQGDNAIKALAEAADLMLYGGAGSGAGQSPAGLGVWLPATGTVICTSTTLTAVAGSSVALARYMKIGRTVWFQGNGAVGAATSPAVLLPTGLAGLPAQRMLNCGSLSFMGSGQSAAQMQTAMMTSPDLQRIVNPLITGSYADTVAGASVRWSVVYETAT